MNKLDTSKPRWFSLNKLPFRLFGFGIIMGCHFLILYSPIFSHFNNQTALYDLVAYRQTLLNVGLAVSFFSILLFNKKIPSTLLSEKNARSLNIVSSLLLIVFIILALISAVYNLTNLHLVSFTLIGFALGQITYLWFHLYSETSVNYSFIYLSISMIIAGILGFLGRYLNDTITIALLVGLPIIAAFMYQSSYQGIQVRSLELAERGKVDKRGAIKPLIAITLKLSMLSLIVGILQGVGTQESMNFFSIDSPYASLGATVAGLIILLLTSNIYYRYRLFNKTQLAITIFLISIVLLPFSKGSSLVFISSLVMFAYIYMDLQVLIQTLNLVRTFDVNSAFLIGLNRGILYASFAVGIVLSQFLTDAIANMPHIPFILSSTCIVLMALFLLAVELIELKPAILNEPMFNAEDLDLDVSTTEESSEDSDDGTPSETPVTPSGKLPFRFRVQHTAELYELSPRETEVLFLIAKGRNAEYVQNALQISSHTAKSHISNIYKKLGVHSAQEMLDVLDNQTVDDQGSYLVK